MNKSEGSKARCFKAMEEPSLNPDHLKKLWALLLRDPLLPPVETGRVDNFKSDFSTPTLDMFTRLLNDGAREFDGEWRKIFTITSVKNIIIC